MKKVNFFTFWLLLTVGLVTVVFSSCEKDDDETDADIAVTGISLNVSTLTLFVGEEETLTATVTPNNATDKTVKWTSSDESKATVSGGKVTAIAAGTAIITAQSGIQTITCTVTVKNIPTPDFDEGVVINGVTWATRNVALPGTFANKPEDAGMMYQWNRKVAWEATGNITDWNSDYPTEDTWEEANDPSPAGWRVPTFDEIEALLDEDKVKQEWTTEKGVNGMKFTDKATGNSMFLPAMGDRDYLTGALSGTAGTNGAYWSSTRLNEALAYNLGISIFNTRYFWANLTFGFNIRSVAN
jgi:uncharacterized protein (TIGR02145 family)